MPAKIAALVVALALIAGLAWGIVNTPCGGCQPVTPMLTILYNAPTANDSSIKLPARLVDQLRGAGTGHRSIRLVRVEHDGGVTARDVDMTPRLDGKANGQILKVDQRIDAAITKIIESIEIEINDADAAGPGHALYLGLSRAKLDPAVPLWIISSGYDTVAPTDLRKLKFEVQPQKLTKKLKTAGELLNLSGAAITFAVVPPAGAQDEPRQPQLKYTRSLWRQLLVASGARSVDFVDLDGGPSGSSQQSPPVIIPPAPHTPVPPRVDPKNPNKAQCVLSAGAYFRVDKPNLVDEAATRKALKQCSALIKSGTTVSVDGYTSTDTGGPNNKFALWLSLARAQTIADLLMELGVRRKAIKVAGHGHQDPPYPNDLASAKNRVVIATFTTR
jgi:outer membrane protein OmpA-like peptidoglycan-associated protein